MKEVNQHNEDLIIGETSQVARYLHTGITRVSARDIPFEIFEKSWNRVYICFAEQRTKFAHDKGYEELFKSINVNLTLDIVKKIRAKRIVYFSTIELWGSLSGPISIDTSFNFEENYYTATKYQATNFIKNLENSIVLYPFNFNSRYRTNDFLFGKIFDSILNRKNIEVGNLDWNRDILHASWVASVTKNASKDQIIGSGTYFNLKKYANDLYAAFGLDFDDFVIEKSNLMPNKKLIYLDSLEPFYTYENLLSDTVFDLKLA